MFEYILGELTVKKIDYVVLDISGLGYKIYISLKTFEILDEVGSDEKLYIYTKVKDENERELFKALISISGVGPKLALAILSTYNVKEIIDIVLDSNAKLFTKVPGLGEKKAQKIILDLVDKVKKLNIIEMYNEITNVVKGKQVISDTSNTRILLMKEDIKLALDSLGYSNADVSKWIKDEELLEINDIGQAIKTILQKIQNKK